MQSEELPILIKAIQSEKKAIIMAHYYQPDEVQAIADYRGDSYELSRQAAETDAEVIVFCGVHFMAESAAILSPDKIVLLPDLEAGCPLAETITPAGLLDKKMEHPEAAVVCYVNSSAEIKALSDICCTSANAVKVVNSLLEKEVLFVPDQNLAHYVSTQTDKKIIAWEGNCNTHHNVTVADVKKAREIYPDSVITVHPECRPEVVALADHVGSTSAILKYARESKALHIVVGTEKGVLYTLESQNPHKQFHLLSPDLICPTMKLIDLQKIRNALETMQPCITVAREVREKAYRALERMLMVS